MMKNILLSVTESSTFPKTIFFKYTSKMPHDPLQTTHQTEIAEAMLHWGHRTNKNYNIKKINMWDISFEGSTKYHYTNGTPGSKWMQQIPGENEQGVWMYLWTLHVLKTSTGFNNIAKQRNLFIYKMNIYFH